MAGHPTKRKGSRTTGHTRSAAGRATAHTAKARKGKPKMAPAASKRKRR